jgi:uncharacterized membrane protein
MPDNELAPVAGADRIDMTTVTRNEFISAMVHLYRGELAEASAWRTRIDATSNWAVVLSVTALSFVFGGTNGERHVLIPIVIVLLHVSADDGGAALSLL